MQSATVNNTKSYQDKKNDCVIRLFQEDGILHHIAAAIPEQKRAVFIEEFLKTEAIQAAVTNFIKEVKLQIHQTLKQQTEAGNNQVIDTGNSVNSQSSILSPSGNTILVEKTSINKYSFPLLDANATVATPAPSSQQNTITPENQTRPVQPSQEVAVPLATQQSIVNPQLKPGEVPPPQAQAPKPTLVSELSKTTFSMSANGRANEEYRGKISGANKSGKTVMIKRVDIPAELGLSFDPVACEVFGIPAKAGEFDLNIHFQFDPPSPADPTPVGTCQLIVNPDPKTLWKNLESDKNDKYWKADTDTVFVPGSDGLAIIVASKRGRSHAHAGTFRDDDFKVDHDVLTGWRIMTVADGAGSAKKSRRGSQIATRVANESIFKALKSERGQKLQDALVAFDSDPSKTQRPVMEELYYLFGNAAREAVHAINTEATTEGVAYKEFSTTLIITIHKKFDFGHFVGAYWVGDGGAGIYLKGQDLNVLGKADSGEFAGQTRFLDSAMVDPTEIMNRIRFKVVKDFTAILAMTDGITDPKFETDANIENIKMWDALWSELEATTTATKPHEALLDWLDFWSAGNHDDRTIGILGPIKPGNSLQQGAN